MQKAEAQHNHAQDQFAQRQGRGASLESLQGEKIAQLEAMAEASPQVGKLAQLAAMANNSPQATAQRRGIDAIHNSPNMTAQRRQLDSLAGKTAQREETEELLQQKVTQCEAVPVKPNNTGLPDNLKSGIESLSGMSMDHVKVHYNSSQPAQLNALAYAQGADIHVAPGQEQHLPHEAWHVVQQAQGRVQPTMQMKEGVPVNDDQSLEHEADVMGAQAAQRMVEASGSAKGVNHISVQLRMNGSLIQPIGKYSYVSQLWPLNGNPTDKYKDSSFQSTTKSQCDIYGHYDTQDSNEFVTYIGKTVQKGGARFKQHQKNKEYGDSMAEFILTSGNWTPFETATHEQYWIGEAGGKLVLDNRINALSTDKWKWFKEPDHGINRDQESDLEEKHFG